MKFDIKGMFKNVGKFADKNAPTICTVLSVVGLGATIYFTRKAAQKEKDIVEDMKASLEDGEELKKKDVIKKVLPIYIPTAISAMATAGFAIASDRIHVGRGVVLSNALAMAYAEKDKIEAKTKEVIGEKKYEEVKSAVAQSKVDDAPLDDKYIIDTGHGDTLFFDSLSGRYFRSSIEYIQRVAERCLGKRIRDEMFISINDMYQENDIPSIDPCIGDNLGWSIDDGEIEFDLRSAIVTDWGEPCVVLDYLVKPMRTYNAY